MPKESLTHEIIRPSRNLDVFFRLFKDSHDFVTNHWHNSIEIIYITAGTLFVTLGQNQLTLKEGDCILINSRVVHATNSSLGNDAILLQIPASFLKRYLPDYESYYFDLDFDSTDVHYQTKLMQFKKILEDMEVVETVMPEAANLRFTSLLFELLFVLYHNFRIAVGSGQTQQSSQVLSQLKPILDYTNQNYNRPITIQEVADLAHLQPEYFCRKFKKYVGQTYLEYLNEVRLTYIYQDLLHTKKTLNEILETHGFTNYKLFRRVFRDKFGCTPGQLRNL